MTDASFTKLMGSILHSSLWGEDHATRIVWITLLALADRDGYVGASVSGIARAACVSHQEAAAAIARFQQPDNDSRNPANEGRRIEVVERGFQLLNYQVFRNMRDKDALRERDRLRKQAQRNKGKA